MTFNIKQKDIWEITQHKCVVAEVGMTIFGDVKLDVNGELVFESPEEVQEFCENLQILSDMLFAQVKDEEEEEEEEEEEDEDDQEFLLLKASTEEMDRVMKLLEALDSKK